VRRRRSKGIRRKYRAEGVGGEERKGGIRSREGRKKPNSFEEKQELNRKGREVNRGRVAGRGEGRWIIEE
jgi:hypothetical protein